jgi:5-methylcytosine-specific restriction endonuclease McrA
MTDPAKPYPKSSQLARGERRYRRKVASAKQWQAIQAAKLGPCRVCVAPSRNGGGFQSHRIQLHHIVPRDLGGDDVPENIAPVCGDCHGKITRRETTALHALAASLTDAEYAYCIDKLGEDALTRLFGVMSR